MKTEKIYIIEFRNSERKRDAVTYRATTINKAFETARKYCKARCVELIGVRGGLIYENDYSKSEV